ncbi:MAG: thioesterase [Treponema sp.]|nr:thioesterase [Treponema sp.]
MNCDAANPKGEGIVPIWQETFPVRFGAIDKSDKLTLDAIFQIFQEAAISHAENLGVGRQEMARTAQAWILSRMTVIADRRPSYCESITVKSWPCGCQKLFAIRDYQINDKNDAPVVSARSAWLIVDMDKRRPLRPQSVVETLPVNEGLHALSCDDRSAEGLEQRNNLEKTAERKALYTDLDYYGHVNNVRYIQWIEDSLDPQLLFKTKKIRLDINYLNEILEGEVIDIYSASLPFDKDDVSHTFAFEGRKLENGQAAFRAELQLWT